MSGRTAGPAGVMPLLKTLIFTILVPGTVAGLSAPATWVIADLAAMSFVIRSL